MDEECLTIVYNGPIQELLEADIESFLKQYDYKRTYAACHFGKAVQELKFMKEEKDETT